MGLIDLPGSQLRIDEGATRFAVVQRFPTLPRCLLGPLVWAAGVGALAYAIVAESPDPLLYLVTGITWVVGPALVLGRRGLTVDRELGLVESWWGLGRRPLRRSVVPLVAPEEVLLKSHHGSKDRRYPVWLVLRDANLPVADPHLPEAAEALAQRLASFLDLPLHDARRR